MTELLIFIVSALIGSCVVSLRENRRLHSLVHQERVTVAMACSALKNVPDRYDDRHAFIASKLEDINKRVARRPK